MANKKLIIEHMEGVHSLMESLLLSGYELSITPVYEEPKKDRLTSYHIPIPRIKHYVVEIGEKLEAPIVEE